MSFFNQPYYALTKTYASRIGIWPEQPKYVRTYRPLSIFAITMTLVVPVIIRILDNWRDIKTLINCATYLLMGIAIFASTLSCCLQFENMKLSLKYIEEHWEMIKNTSAVIVLDRYAERGRKITVIYSSCLYVALMIYISVCLSPTILDFVNPLNETRPKVYVIEAEYGVDADKYHWLILAHTFIVLTMVLSIVVALETMYILWVVHACALFEVVGFNLEVAKSVYPANKGNAITLRSDWHYEQICHCITVHAEAISYSDLVESGCFVSAGLVFGITAIITVITAVQAEQLIWYRYALGILHT